MLFPLRSTLVGLASLAIGSAAVNAATIVTYDFNGDGVGTVDGSFTGVVTAGDYNPRTAEIGDDGASNTISGFSVQNDNVYLRSTGTTISSLPDSGTNAYHTFSISVSGLGANEVLDLTSFTFNYDVTGTTASTAYFFSVFSDSIGTPDDQGSADRLANGNYGGSVLPVSVDLTSGNTVAGSTFTGLGNGSDIVFRIYFGDDGSNDNNTGSIHRVRQDLVVNGDIRVVPEPQTYALFAGVMAAGLLVLRRRR